MGWAPALDGLRGVAVLSVALFHWHEAALPGGFLGVDVFFVLSGFLITTLLLQERRETGGISLSRFWMRRALRLLPALGAFLAVFVPSAMLSPDTWLREGQTRADALLHVSATLAYGYNFVAATETPLSHGMDHLWSLSVEEQFYLVWPPVVALLAGGGAVLSMGGGRVRRRLLWCAAGGALAAAAMPIIVALLAVMLGFDITWRTLYFSTLFRAHELLAGAVASMLFLGGAVTAVTTRRWWFAAGLALSCGYLVWLAQIADERPTAMYAGGYQLVAVASSVIVLWCVLRGDSLIARGLSAAPIAYVGRRSYGIYIWHLFAGRLLAEAGPGGWLLALIATLAAAELSYRVVEAPALRLKARLSRGEGLGEGLGGGDASGVGEAVGPLPRAA